MKKLLIATKNQGKIKEIQAKLKDFEFEIIGLNELDLPVDFDVEEPAMTMEGNAIIKAMTYGNKSRILTLADDAGLEVDVLDGRPGVFSSRYAPGTDEDRYLKLLDEMENVPDGQRGAQFRAVIAIYDSVTEKIRTCEGTYSGEIIREARGNEGFGYDPIFFNKDKNKTIAEMSLEEKNEVSHRGKALNKATDIIKREFMI